MSDPTLDDLRSAYQRAAEAVDLPDTPTDDPWKILDAASDAAVAAHKLIEAQAAEIERLDAHSSSQYAAGYSRGSDFATQRARAALQRIIIDHGNADDAGQPLKATG